MPPDLDKKELGLVDTAVNFVKGLMWALSVEARFYLAERLLKTLGPELNELKRQGKA